MYGLTHYDTAPEMALKGSVTLADGVHEIEGVGCGYCRFDNGDTITWRRYYGNPSGELEPRVPYDVKAARESWNHSHHEVTRYACTPKGEAPEYSFSPSFRVHADQAEPKP